MPEGIVEQVGDVGHVDVRVAEQTSRKVSWVVMGAEDAAKLGVEQRLGGFPQLVTFLEKLFYEV